MYGESFHVIRFDLESKGQGQTGIKLTKNCDIDLYLMTLTLDDNDTLSIRLGIPKTIRMHTKIIGIGLVLLDV